MEAHVPSSRSGDVIGNLAYRSALFLTPLLVVWSFVATWLAAERACAERIGYNSFASGITVFLFLFIGLPLAYSLVAGMVLLLRRRARLLRLGATVVALAVAWVLLMALQIGDATGPRCATGVPDWWPLPHRG